MSYRNQDKSISPGERRVISRIARMEYDNKSRRLFFVLRDYNGTFWFYCEDDDEANNLSARMGCHMEDYFEFHFNRNTGQLLDQPHRDSYCILS